MCKIFINIAPEVICRMNHSFVSDFYAVGVIAYELATGKVYLILIKRPHNGISRN
jgi:serine/threonine kinase 32